ncbi:MAG: AAA family ATPase [Bacteroidales bacterium]
MPQQTKTFRVFVSSTFTDMKQERGILMRDAFPRLEKYCEENNAKFQAVDLRWGVNEDAARDQKTLQICFNEVARCQKISPKPNFLILLGNRYGWQPVPEIIPKEEGIAICDFLKGAQKSLFEKWYKQDFNSIYEHFVLQPKDRLKKKADENEEDLKIREYQNWENTEKELRNLLRMSVKELKFSEIQLEKYLTSATHQEIIKGALNPPNDVKEPEKHIFAFSRNINDLPNNVSAKDYTDLIGNEPDFDSEVKLTALKKELGDMLGVCHINKIPQITIKEKEEEKRVYDLPTHYVNYDAKWVHDCVELDDLQKFNDVVFDALKKVISEQLALEDVKDEINHEVKLHSEFKTRLTEHFKGRDEILKTIQRYLDNKNEKRVMSLIGESGTGKSSVIAQAIKQNENDGSTFVYRFIGTSSGSSNIMSLLQSVCNQIAKAYGVDAKTLAREGNEKAWYDMNGLADVLRKCLALATEQKPILLFLDSLDQLSDTDNAKALYWLPRELPDHARFVVSSLKELEPALSATDKVELPVMPVEDAVEILKKWFSSIHRTLTKDQKDLVIGSFSKNQLPIYLKLAFEKARKWHSYDKQHTLKEDVAGIINDYFDDLEIEHDKDFVTNAVCYLLSGRYMGLAENEILEILAFDPEYWELFLEKNKYHKDDLTALKTFLEGTNREKGGYMKIPIATWSRLYLDLEPFLTERDADGVPIITFFHRQFNEVLRERYLLIYLSNN